MLVPVRLQTIATAYLHNIWCRNLPTRLAFSFARRAAQVRVLSASFVLKFVLPVKFVASSKKEKENENPVATVT